jgi:NAD+ kinase
MSRINIESYGPHLIHFFYMRVGREVARVELPRWVAEDRAAVDLVHTLIYDQCMKGQGYPVALARAHEQAIVRAADRRAFLSMVEGSLLRAARLATPRRIPVLPVALGRLSFMAELQPDELTSGLETLLAGGGWLDERTLLEATIHHAHDGGGESQRFLALNEVLVARGEINRVVAVDIEIYHALLTTYHCDGVVVSSATGSTAYSLAAGGPIIDPRSTALALVPIAAHLTNIPSLILHQDAVVTIRLRSRHPAAFSADGRESIPLHAGDVVEVRRANEVCIFARVHPPSTFYARLAQRLRREG